MKVIETYIVNMEKGSRIKNLLYLTEKNGWYVYDTHLGEEWDKIYPLSEETAKELIKNTAL